MATIDGFSDIDYAREEADWSAADELRSNGGGWTTAELRALGIDPNRDRWDVIYDEQGHGHPVKIIEQERAA